LQTTIATYFAQFFVLVMAPLPNFSSVILGFFGDFCTIPALLPVDQLANCVPWPNKTRAATGHIAIARAGFVWTCPKGIKAAVLQVEAETNRFSSYSGKIVNALPGRLLQSCVARDGIAVVPRERLEYFAVQVEYLHL
jgi:hypothetical protein